jgi:hypothetical protein
MGNASSVGIGDTVHLVIGLSNLGPKSCDAKLNYKIPVGLKLLSSQGPGVYDSVSGVWNAGVLLVNDSVSLDLVLQAVNTGYFVNLVSVYGDLTSTHAHAVIPVVKVFNGKWRSSAAMGDSNSGNNRASFSLDVKSPTDSNPTPDYDYKWPDDVPDPTPDPIPDPQPRPDPTPDPKPKPPWDPQPSIDNDQLPRDIKSVRDIVSGVKDAKLANWNMTLDSPIDKNELLSYAIDIAAELIYIGAMVGTPGSGEYLQQVKNGMMEAGAALKMAANYFTKDPRRALNILKNSFKNMGENKNQIKFLDDFSKNTFKIDPNIAQKVVGDALCEIFPKQAGKIKAFFNVMGSVQFLLDPLEIWKSWGEVIYSLFVDGFGHGDYGKTVDNFWEALDKTFNHPIPGT